MEPNEFVDYYETLEISPNANSGTIERMFRYLAQCYHPDNRETGDRSRFDAIVEAHEILRNPEKRAQFDVTRKTHSGVRRKLAEEAADHQGMERDAHIQTSLLSILYVKRRQSTNEPGLSTFTLESMLGCPAEHLEFHLWYLKEKGWIAPTENGLFAITVAGIDQANSQEREKVTNKLLTHQRQEQ
jgi:curved DNA-binding protein CbpA